MPTFCQLIATGIFDGIAFTNHGVALLRVQEIVYPCFKRCCLKLDREVVHASDEARLVKWHGYIKRDKAAIFFLRVSIDRSKRIVRQLWTVLLKACGLNRALAEDSILQVA